jgi:uncharacterized membrane protein
MAPEPRWVRFALTLAALAAILVGVGAAAATDDVAALWWGVRVAGAVTAVSGGLTVAYRDAFAAGVGRTDRSRRATPRYHAVTGTARALLGAALVVATVV